MRFCGIVFQDVLLEELIDERQDGIGILGPAPGLADPFRDRSEHLAQPLAVGACGHPQPVAEVVHQDDVPVAEELGRQEVRHRSIRTRLARVQADQVIDVAVKDEQASRAGEVLVGEFPGPGGKPPGNRSGFITWQQLRRGGSWRTAAAGRGVPADEAAGSAADVPFTTDRSSSRASRQQRSCGRPGHASGLMSRQAGDRAAVGIRPPSRSRLSACRPPSAP